MGLLGDNETPPLPWGPAALPGYGLPERDKKYERAFQYSPAPILIESEAESFWAAICAEPFDAAPRLVAADWWEEKDTEEGRMVSRVLREWPGGFDKMKRLSHREAYAHGLVFHPDCGPVNSAIDRRMGSLWLGELTHFYQAVREGLFLYRPIQRVLITDIGQRFTAISSLTESGYRQEYLLRGRETESGIWESLAYVAEWGLGATRLEWVVASLPEAELLFSYACVDLGRRASGLRALGRLEDPERGVWSVGNVIAAERRRREEPAPVPFTFTEEAPPVPFTFTPGDANTGYVPIEAEEAPAEQRRTRRTRRARRLRLEPLE